MRIALIAPNVRPTGGQDRYVLELARRLSGRHEVHLLAVGVAGLEGSGVVVHRVRIRERPALFFAAPFARRTARTLVGGGFDVIHAIGGCMPGAAVITAQFCHAAWREARLRYRVREGSPPHRWYQARVNREAEAFERRAYAHPALRAIIAVSRRTSEELTAHYGVPPSRIGVIPNGVDTELFDRERYPDARGNLRRTLGLDSQASVALLVGTYARKGLETAIAAVAHTSMPLHLVVAGTGDQREVRRWASDAGLGGRLHLLGPRADVAQLYAAADVFVLPTRYDPFAMVITEAMASRLPVVVSGCAGAAELIRHGENGFVVAESDDAMGFATAMDAVLADRARAAAVGEAARIAAAATSWPSIVARTETTYEQAIA